MLYPLSLAPLHGLAPVPGPGRRQQRWQATNDDPHFLMNPGRSIAAGWYVLSMELQATEGRLVHPSLYYDAGEGFSEHTRIALPISPGRRQRLLLFFPQAVRCLRFDPSESPCTFDLRAAGLRRIAGIEALARVAWPALPRPLWSRACRRFLVDVARELWRRRRLLDVSEATWATHQLRLARAGQAARYLDWVAKWEQPLLEDLPAINRTKARIKRNPSFSIVMPVYNTPERWLRLCIESVLGQLYPNWQLCIADDASTDPRVREVLREYSARDTRIKLVLREQNGHISAASNSALKAATGDFIVLLDHDDELSPFALLAVAQDLEAHPKARVLYSDEDKIDEQGRRYDPYFKPDWNAELILGQNMLSHLGVYETALVREVGGFRAGLEGSQDFDLALRCLERIDPCEVRHIPMVLYHWRAISGSTASHHGEKSYAQVAACRAVKEHLARREVSAAVEMTAEGYLKVDYALPQPPPTVSLIVPTRNGLALVRTCVESILAKTDYPSFEIVIVDNQSDDPATLKWLSEIVAADSRVKVLRYDRPFNFSAINNFAVARSDGQVIGLINNDIEAIHSEWLAEMVAVADRPDVGAVGAMLYYPNDTIQHAGVYLGLGGVAGHAYCHKPRGHHGQMSRLRLRQEVSAVTAACLLVRRDRYQEVAGLDEGLVVAFNDVDFCLRLRDRGYRNVWTPHAELYHHESASRGHEDTPEKQARFRSEVRFMIDRWGSTLEQDPAYNPNLSLTAEPFTLDMERTPPLQRLLAEI